MSDENSSGTAKNDGDNSDYENSPCSSESFQVSNRSNPSSTTQGLHRGGGDPPNENRPAIEDEHPIRLAWKSIRCYRSTCQQENYGESGEAVADSDTVLRDVSGFANASSIVLIAGMTPLPPLTLLRTLAGEINPDGGQVIRGGTAGLENMTVSIDNSRGNDRRQMLFDHLGLEDSIASYVHRALPDQSEKTDTKNKELQETIGSVLYQVTAVRELITVSLPEYIANFVTLNMVLSCARKLILLDEPFIGLRYWQVTYIINLLKNLREKGCTIIISSSVHATLLLKNADRIYLFDRDGSLILQGRPSNPEVFKRTASQSHTFAQTVSHIARFKRDSTGRIKQEEARVPQQLETLPRIKRGLRGGDMVFSEIMLNEITSNVWLIPVSVMCSCAFATMCAFLAAGRNQLGDQVQPYFDMNIYFFLQVFVALQSLHMGFRATRCFLRVANREWRNATYTLIESLLALSSTTTTMSTLCTSSVCMFVFLVTGQQQVRGEITPGSRTASSWAPFLFILAGLLTAYNFGRVGFLLAFLYDPVSSRKSVFIGHLCLLLFLAMAIVPCRLFIVHGLDIEANNVPIGWKIASFVSPLSMGQELMFYAVYATQGNVLCPEPASTISNSTSVLNDKTAECVAYSTLAGVGNTVNSFVLLPILFRAVSVSLWIMTLSWFFGTLVWARRRYDPFLKAVPDMHLGELSLQKSISSEL